MTVDIIVALSVAIIVFFVLVAVWYFVAVPSKRKALAEEARENAEKEAEVIKQKKLLEVKEKFLSKRTELEKEVRQHNQQIQQLSMRHNFHMVTIIQLFSYIFFNLRIIIY